MFYMKPEMMVAWLFYITLLQEQMIQAQQENIQLRKRIDEMTPTLLPDKEIFWHIASGGTWSIEAAASNDLAVVQAFLDWNINFATKHIKPYVNPKVFGECLNQMTRGLPERIAKLEAAQLEEARVARAKAVAEVKPEPATQLPLIQ